MNARSNNRGGRSLGLRIPECAPGAAPNYLAQPEEMEEWIASLPIANIGETGRQVYTALCDFSRHEIPDAERLRVAELLRKPLAYVKSNLEKHYIDNGLPLSPKGRKIAALNQVMQEEMAIPYKIVVENSLTSRRPLGKELLVLATTRAINYLSDVLQQAALTYTPDPAGTWQEIHRLFAFAAQNKLDQVLITDGDATDKQSIGQLYKRILLFALASPSGLRQRESQFIYKKLLDWSGHVELAPITDTQDQSDLFLIELASDQPPRHIGLQHKAPGQNSLGLDTHGLIEYLRSHSKQLAPGQKRLKPGQEDHVLSRSLLKRLVRVWSTAPDREDSRDPQSTELGVVVGLSSIHALLKKNLDEKRHAPTARELADIDWLKHQVALDQAFGGANHDTEAYSPQEVVFSLNPADENGAGGPARKYSPSIVGTTLQANTPAPWADDRSRPTSATLSRKSLNESTGGYCISWLGPDTTKVRVGELMAIQSPKDNGQTGIGVIRWMKETPAHELQLGVQMLAADCLPVRTRRPEDKRGDNRKTCLLLPEIPAKKEPATLITPTFLYQIGESLRIENEEQEYQVTLERQVETTGAFARFQFAESETQETHAAPASELQEEDDAKPEGDLDSVWDML